jgi:hypothetical protein
MTDELTWNYRIVRNRAGKYSVRMVTYMDGRITGWSSDPAVPLDREDMLAIGRAWARPTLVENQWGLLVPATEGETV